MVRENSNRGRRRSWAAAVVIAVAASVAFPATVIAKEVIILPDEQPERGKADAPDGRFRLDREEYLLKLSLLKGTEYFQQARYAEAKAEMEWVLSVDPEHEQARRILAAAKTELAKVAAAPAPEQAHDAVRHNRLEMECRYYQANRLIADGKYEEAVPKLEMVEAIGRNIEGAEELLADAAALLRKAREHRNARTSPEAAAARKEAHDIALAYEKKQREREQQRARALFDQAKKYYNLREFTRALDCADAALKIDENDPAAQSLKRRIETDGEKAIAADLAAKKRRSHDKLIAETYESAIPQRELLVPPDTPARHRVPDAAAPEAEASGPAVDAIKGGLQKKISCGFNGIPLVDAISYLKKASGCNMALDPRCACKDDPVAGLKVADTEMVHVLSTICRMHGLQWAVKDETIIVSDREITEEKTTEVHDITDLCIDPQDLPSGSHLAMTVGMDPTTTEANGRRSATDEANLKERNARGQEMADLIRWTIEPGTWGGEGNGRQANTIQYRSGKLVVSHNRDVHRKIAKLLDAFRRARAVQVSILTRYVDVSRDYLEQIGIDWSGLDNLITRGVSRNTSRADGITPIRSGAAYQGSGRVDEFGIPVPLAPWYQNQTATAPGTFGPTRGTPSEAPFALDDTLGRRPWPDLLPGGGRPGGSWDFRGSNVNENTVAFPDATSAWNPFSGLYLDIAFLSRYQVRALIHAVEKQKRDAVLTSPRITCFNGQRANIVVATLTNYIQTYDDSGTPTIQTVTDGVVLEVKPYVSADQRYVTMELLPSITELRGFVTFEIWRGFTVEGNVVFGMIPIQLPEVFVRSVETTVSVPDGGTILIGGLANATESEGYASVPLLSKIPIIKYLFMNWGRIDTRTNLVILVTADILIQTEIEQQVAASK